MSGGADSTALLVLAVAAGCDVTAHHVDHGLRAGSAAEASVVERHAATLGAGFVAHRAILSDGPDLEARARNARYSTLPPAVVTGHTADDQAETLLLFLMRGTGPEGLAGMDPARRPLLRLRRAETAALCSALALDVVDDPSNADPRFRRNRVRHEVLPLLDDVAGRDVAPLLARAAELQRRHIDAIAVVARSVDPTDVVALRDAPEAVAAHALRTWWRDVTGLDYAPDAAALERMQAVVHGVTPRTDVWGGWSLTRTDGRLRLVLANGRVDSDVIR